MKEKIKELTKQLGMDMCGVAPIERFSGSPEGKNPLDILPGCKSVIVIGIRLLDGAMQANFRAVEDGRQDLKGIYGMYAYSTFPNFQLAYCVYTIAQFIERETGEVATPLSTGPVTNGNQMSIRHAAVAAGLGEIGWMGIIITPEFGTRNRFGVILTTAEIEPDDMYNGPRLCNPEKCGICVKVCPAEAMSTYGSGEAYAFDMDGRHFEYCKLNVPRCNVSLMQLRKKYGGKEDYVSSDEPSMAEIVDAMKDAFVVNEGIQDVGTWHCGLCQVYCPTGNWGEKFKARGLSAGVNAIIK